MSGLIPRRGLLLGLGALFAAPAIVRASSLMPVKQIWRGRFEPLPFNDFPLYGESPAMTTIVDLRELEQIKARILIQWDKIAR